MQRARSWWWWLSNCRCWDRIFRRCSQTESRRFRPRRSLGCLNRPTLPCASIGQRAHWWCWLLSNCRCWDYICRQCSHRSSRQRRPRQSFRCRSRLPCESRAQRARWLCWWPSNYPCWDYIARRYLNAPFRPRRSFRCRSRLPCGRIGQRARWWCW